MEKIEKKINSFIVGTLVTMLVMIGLGLVFFIFPGTILNVLRWVMVVVLGMGGIGALAGSISRGGTAGTVVGVILFMLALLIAMHPETMNIVMIVLGLCMVVNSATSLAFLKDSKNTSAYTMSVISSLIGLTCGVIMFIHPGESTEAIMQIAGVLLMVYGVSGMIEAITVKARINDVKNGFKNAKKTAEKLLDSAEEAEVVEKKSAKKSK